PLYLRRLCLHLHLCWQAAPAKINRTRHSLVRTTGLHIKSTAFTFRPYGTVVARLACVFYQHSVPTGRWLRGWLAFSTNIPSLSGRWLRVSEFSGGHDLQFTMFYWELCGNFCFQSIIDTNPLFPQAP
ncbi:MAG: hypothetical protein LBD59_02545, partial [Prevotellaceae bacterium]|nr:hypothetical protein [Prevotellaceae bacterium]